MIGRGAFPGDRARIRRTATPLARGTRIRRILVLVTFVGKTGHRQPDTSCAVSTHNHGEKDQYRQVSDERPEPISKMDSCSLYQCYAAYPRFFQAAQMESQAGPF